MAARGRTDTLTGVDGNLLLPVDRDDFGDAVRVTAMIDEATHASFLSSIDHKVVVNAK